MPTVNKESLRNQFNQAKLSAELLTAQGKVAPETQALITTLIMLMELVMAVFLEKMTKKTKSNSGVPPSSTSKENDVSEESHQGAKSKGPNLSKNDFSNAKTIETIDRVQVLNCDCCGEDLTDIDAVTVERRTRIDLYFEKVVEHQETEKKTCSRCKNTIQSQFGPRFQHMKQYGSGLQAFIVDLLCSQMVSLKRVQQLLASVMGEVLSESTLLKYVLKLHRALEVWEKQAIEALLKSKAMHVDETSMRVDKKNYWVHVCSAGLITVKQLHRKRGKEAMDEHNIIPRYSGVIVHDCWASYFKYDSCDHGLCGAHIIRELSFVIESNEYLWAKRMRKLLLLTCKSVARQQNKKLSQRRYQYILSCYNEILKQGQTEMPSQPVITEKKRGRVAKTDAENLHDRLTKYQISVLLFATNEHVPFTNNQAERALRMGKVKQKVSGSFRTPIYAHAYVRISSYLQTMTAHGFNPLKAIQMALAGEIYSPQIRRTNE